MGQDFMNRQYKEMDKTSLTHSSTSTNPWHDPVLSCAAFVSLENVVQPMTSSRSFWISVALTSSHIYV